MIKIAPSLLAADFYNLNSEINKLNNTSSDWLHLDVMDGIFVPNISFGFDIIKQLRNHTNLFFDTHLMIKNPINYIKQCSDAGCDLVTFHYEACDDEVEVINTIKSIKDNNMKVGISIKPNTNIEVLFSYLKDVDLVLVMSVEPGFGGQSFMKDQLNKVKYLNDLKDKYNYLIEIDGGINNSNYKDAIDYGCDVLVAGSYLFNEDMENKIVEMKKYAN